MVSKIKKRLYLLLCNFSSRWNNSALCKTLETLLNKLERHLLTYKTKIYLKIFRKNISWKKEKIIKFNDKNLFVSSIHPYLFGPSIWTFMKIKCNRIKYIFVEILYNVIVILGFVKLGKPWCWYLFDPSIWTLRKIKCNKTIFTYFCYSHTRFSKSG